jgi:uncharacterized protein YjeT (DUF2065 family)
MSEIVSTIVSLMLLILGLSYLFQSEKWARLAKDALDHPHRYFPMALCILVMGLIIVMTHNIWTLSWPVAVTLFGWIMTIKGIFYLLFPQFTKIFESWSENAMRIYIRSAGIIVTILGAILVYQLIIAA